MPYESLPDCKIDTDRNMEGNATYEMGLVEYRLALSKDIICTALFRKWKGIKLEWIEIGVVAAKMNIGDDMLQPASRCGKRSGSCINQ